MTKFEEIFTKYTEARLPIIYVDTLEDDKAKEIILEICRDNERGIFEWNLFGAYDYSDEVEFPKSDLASTLQILITEDNLDNKILILQDVHFFLDKPETISTLRIIGQGINSGKYDCSVCILAPLVTLPKELENYITIMELDDLTENEIKNIVNNFVENITVKPEDDLIEKMVTRLKGLSRTEILNILSLSASEGGELTYADLPLILEHKQQMIKKSGILEMIRVKESMDDIGGLENLKDWLSRKSAVFKQIKKARDFGVDIPKGVLIAGMPGCGKSLTAKAASTAFEVPLLRLDMGRGEQYASCHKSYGSNFAVCFMD